MGIKKLRNILVLLSLVFIISANVNARPISWPGGNTYMYKSDATKTSKNYHYSPSYKYSIGVGFVNDKYFKEEYINFRGTYLLDRRNTKKSQRNFYITGALSGKSSDNFFYGVHGDWETRRYFTSVSYINKYTKQKNYIEKEFQVGVAPYIGEYGDIHTWLMIKAKRNTINDNWETYPFIKLFTGDYMVEIGNKNSHWDLHLMARF